MVPPLLINEQNVELSRSLIAEYNEKAAKWGYDQIGFNEETREVNDPGYPFPEKGGLITAFRVTQLQELYKKIIPLSESRMINIPYFRPLLENFCNKFRHSGIDPDSIPYGVFLPYVFQTSYYKADRKIFYMGRDTYGWIPFNEMMRLYDNNNIWKYLNQTTYQVDDDKALEWGNSSGAFWPFILKLHIYIRPGKYVEDLSMLDESSDERLSLYEIGYGNMNAMELPESLDNEGVDYDPQAYAKVKELSTPFDRIKHILDAYSPDFIFIFNWVDAEEIFEGLNVTWHKEHYIDDKLAVYTIEGYSTKIIWSSHPRRFSFIGENTESMVRLLGNKFNELI